MIDFTKYKATTPLVARKLNPRNIPITRLGFNDIDIDEFNEIYQFCLQCEKEGTMKKFELTEAGNIRTAHGAIRGARYKLSRTKTLIDLTIRYFDAKYYRFQVGYKKEKDDFICGTQAFNIYKGELKKHNIDIEKLAISAEEGLEVKKTIPKPRIKCTVAPERIYTNAHHIDLNSAYNAGMMEAFPVLEPAIRAMYNQRAIKPVFKDVLNMTQGYMQSEKIGYKFSHISKAGYVYTERRLDELTEALINSGRRILGYNTDGIWYQGSIYTDDNEGPDIGQYKHDYINCRIRYKSDGCYEFEGTNTKTNEFIYKPVFRGESTYEAVKPRDQWTWGDIFNGDVKEYCFIEDRGIVKC